MGIGKPHPNKTIVAALTPGNLVMVQRSNKEAETTGGEIMTGLTYIRGGGVGSWFSRGDSAGDVTADTSTQDLAVIQR